MKPLILKDGTEVKLSDSSTKYDMVTTVPSWGDIDSLNLTKENVEGAKYLESPIQTVFVKVYGELSGRNVLVHIITREKTKDEKRDEEIAELKATIDLLMMGGM